jgi:hypothetical protein
VLTDNQIDEIGEQLRLAGLSDNEVLTFKNLIKQNDELKLAIAMPEEDFAAVLKNASSDSSVVETGFKKVYSLTSDEVDNVVAGVVKKKISDPDSKLSGILTKIDEVLSLKLKKLKQDGKKISNVEEIEDVFDGYICKILSEQNLNDDLAEEIFQQLKKKWRENSKTKSLLDEFNSSGRVSNSPKRTTSVTKYDKTHEIPELTHELKISRDTVSGEKMFDDQMNPIKNTEDLSDDISDYYDTLLTKRNNGQSLTTEELDFIDSVEKWKNNDVNSDVVGEAYAKATYEETDWNTFGSNLRSVCESSAKKIPGWRKFYIKLRSFYRIWVESARALFKRNPMDRVTAFKQFEEEFQRGFDEFVANYNLKSEDWQKFTKTAYMREIKDKLGKIKGNFVDGNLKDKAGTEFTREQLWENFKINGRNAMTTETDKLQFDNFVKTLEADKTGGGMWEATWDEILADGLPEIKTGLKDSSTSLKSTLEAGQKVAEEFGKNPTTSNAAKMLGRGTIKRLRFSWKNILSLIMTGTYATPRELQLYFIQKGYRGKSAIEQLITDYAVSNFFVPLIFGFASLIISGFNSIAFNKKTEFGDDENWFTYHFGQYFLNGIFSARETTLELINLFRDPDIVTKNPDWVDRLNRILPGLADKTIYELIDLSFAGVKNVGETTQEKKERLKSEGMNKINSESTKKYNNATPEEKLIIEDDTADFDGIKDWLILDYKKLRLTKSESDFLIKNIKFVSKVPGDYFKRLKEKIDEIKDSTATDDVEVLNKIKGYLGGDVDIEKLNLSNLKDRYSKLKNFTGGSAVLTGKSGKMYLVVIATTRLPYMTREVINNYLNDYEVKWVKPSFNELNENSTREYFNLKEFINQYAEL